MKRFVVSSVVVLLLAALVIPGALAQTTYPDPGSAVTNVVVSEQSNR